MRVSLEIASSNSSSAFIRSMGVVSMSYTSTEAPGVCPFDLLSVSMPRAIGTAAMHSIPSAKTTAAT